MNPMSLYLILALSRTVNILAVTTVETFLQMRTSVGTWPVQGLSLATIDGKMNY
jgi:hypothetical protein